MTLQEELEAEAKNILLLPHPWCGHTINFEKSEFFFVPNSADVRI